MDDFYYFIIYNIIPEKTFRQLIDFSGLKQAEDGIKKEAMKHLESPEQRVVEELFVKLREN